MFSTLIQCDLIFLLTYPPLILLREILYHSFLDLLDAGKLTLTNPLLARDGPKNSLN